MTIIYMTHGRRAEARRLTEQVIERHIAEMRETRALPEILLAKGAMSGPWDKRGLRQRGAHQSVFEAAGCSGPGCDQGRRPCPCPEACRITIEPMSWWCVAAAVLPVIAVSIIAAVVLVFA